VEPKSEVDELKLNAQYLLLNTMFTLSISIQSLSKSARCDRDDLS
jgi:hypothetical protein